MSTTGIAAGFSPQARSFSKKNMAYLATCANLAYKSQEVIEEVLGESFDLNHQTVFFKHETNEPDRGTQGFIVGDRKKIIISFRGSEADLKDWGHNFSIMREDWTDEKHLGTVHDGFVDALNSVWDQIRERLVALRDNNQSIWLTGHSLGGALAALTAATMELQDDFEVAGVYTFGQPRIGNRKFSVSYNGPANSELTVPESPVQDDSLKKKTFRCVNQRDVVTRCPPQIMGFRHVGQLVFFNYDGSFHLKDRVSYWANFWDHLQSDIEDLLDFSVGIPQLLLPDIIEDHLMDNYEARCRELIGIDSSLSEAWRSKD